MEFELDDYRSGKIKKREETSVASANLAIIVAMNIMIRKRLIIVIIILIKPRPKIILIKKLTKSPYMLIQIIII